MLTTTNDPYARGNRRKYYMYFLYENWSVFVGEVVFLSVFLILFSNSISICLFSIFVRFFLQFQLVLIHFVGIVCCVVDVVVVAVVPFLPI